MNLAGYISISLTMQNTIFNSEICKHQQCLESFAMKFTNDVEDANDLVQDTLIKAIRYHHLYEPGTNLRGWLFTILRNTFINDYRKKSRHRNLFDTNEEISSGQLSHSAIRNNSEDKFLLEDINKALDTVSDDYKTPFLKYFQGFKYHEIAEELQIPIGTVKTRIHMARQQLKRHLKMYHTERRLELSA